MNIGLVLAVLFIFVQTSQQLFFSEGTKVRTPGMIVQLSATTGTPCQYIIDRQYITDEVFACIPPTIAFIGCILLFLYHIQTLTSYPL